MMVQREIGSLGNPCFSYDRCPRYKRLHDRANEREHARLGLELDRAAGGADAKLSRASWKKRAAKELAKWEEDNKEADGANSSLWALAVHSDEVRPMPAEESAAEGYTHALVITNDRKSLTVGVSRPLPGEKTAHHTVFLAEYDSAAQAQSTGGGEDGVLSVRTVNDTCAIIIYELGLVTLAVGETVILLISPLHPY